MIVHVVGNIVEEVRVLVEGSLSAAGSVDLDLAHSCQDACFRLSTTTPTLLLVYPRYQKLTSGNKHIWTLSLFPISPFLFSFLQLLGNAFLEVHLHLQQFILLLVVPLVHDQLLISDEIDGLFQLGIELLLLRNLLTDKLVLSHQLFIFALHAFDFGSGLLVRGCLLLVGVLEGQ